MATIRQLAGNSATPQVSSALTQVSGVGSANYRSGESLANDLLKIMGEGSKTAQTYYTASDVAAKRVAMDKMTELNKFIANTEAATNFNDPKSLSEAQRQIALKQAELSDVEFDLEDAQDTFDNVYTKPASVNTARINAKLKMKELELIDINLFKKTTSDLDEAYRVGNKPSAEVIEASVDTVTASGRLDREQGYLAVAKTSTNAFENKTATTEGLKNVLGDAKFKGTWDLSAKQKTFENEFGAYGKIDKEGNIAFRKGVGEQAQAEIRRAWGRFNSSMSSTGGSGLNPFKDLNAKVQADTTNQKSTYRPSMEIANNYTKNLEALGDIAKTKQYTASQLDDAKRNLKKQLNNIRITQQLEKQVYPLLYDKTKTAELSKMLKKNTTITYQDALTNQDNTVAIKPDKIKEMIAYERERIQGELSNLDLSTPEGDAQYVTSYRKLRQLERIRGDGSSNQSSVTIQTKNLANLKTTILGVSNENEVAALIKRLEVMGDPNVDDDENARILASSYAGEYNRWKQLPDGDKNKTMPELIKRLEKVTAGVKNRDDAKVDKADMRAAAINHYNENFHTGGQGRLWGFEADASHKTRDIKQLTRYLASDVIPGSYEDKLDSIEWVDIGTLFWGAKDVRFPAILCSTRSYGANCGGKTKKAVQAMIKDAGLKDENVDVIFEWKGENWELSLYKKGDRTQHIGILTKKNLEQWSIK